MMNDLMNVELCRFTKCFPCFVPPIFALQSLFISLSLSTIGFFNYFSIVVTYTAIFYSLRHCVVYQVKKQYVNYSTFTHTFFLSLSSILQDLNGMFYKHSWAFLEHFLYNVFRTFYLQTRPELNPKKVSGMSRVIVLNV